MSLAQAAYLKLEALIVGQHLPPGALLTEGQLIDRLEMGRTPVREAIQRLAWEGLLEVRPRAGIKVADLRPDDFPKVLAMRVVLEPMLVRASVANAAPNMRALLAPMRHAMVAVEQAGDVAGFMRVDRDFDT